MTRKQAEIVFDDVRVPARSSARRGRHRRRHPRPGCTTIAAAALAFEQVGGAQQLPGDVGRVRQGAHPVRSSHRLVPGDQAQVCRHAGRRSSRPSRRPTTPVGRPSEGNEELAIAGAARQVVLLGRLLLLSPARASRSTAASGSPGSTTPISTSSGPRPISFSSGIRHTGGRSSPIASISSRQAGRQPSWQFFSRFCQGCPSEQVTSLAD